MSTSEIEFSHRILKNAASPRVAAECFAQDATNAGIELTDLQRNILLVLRYDDILQVHGVARVRQQA